MAVYEKWPTIKYAPFTVGKDDVGHDVKFFGATSGSYWQWDESVDAVVLVGDMGITGNLTLEGDVTVTGGVTWTGTVASTITNPTAPDDAFLGTVDVGVGYSAGSVNAVKGVVTSSAVAGQTVRNMSAGWFGLTWESTHAATGVGCTRALAAEVVTACASAIGHPNAIVYLQSIPSGASSSHATMPYIVFTETATGTGSNILFECGHEAAGTTVTAGDGLLFDTTTLQIKVNTLARYLPLSTVKNALTTAAVITTSNTTAATNSTSGALIVGGGVGIAAKLYVGTNLDVTGTSTLDDAVTCGSTLAVTGIATFSTHVRLGDNDLLQFGGAQEASITWTDSNWLAITAAANSPVLFGAGAAGLDVRFYSSADGDRYLVWDASGDEFLFHHCDLRLEDNDYLEFGDAAGGDAKIYWSDAALVISAAADVLIQFGAAAAGVDARFYSSVDGDKYVTFDASANVLNLRKFDIYMSDSGTIYYGDSQDLVTAYDAGDNKFMIYGTANNTELQLGYSEHGMDVETYGNTAGTLMLWDASDGALEITNASVDVAIADPGASVEAIDSAVTQAGTSNLTGTSLKAVKGYTTWTATAGYTGNSYGGWFGVKLDAASGMERGGLVTGLYAEAHTARTENCQPNSVAYFQSVVSGDGIMTNSPILVLTSTGGSNADKSMYAIELGHAPASTTVSTGSGGMYHEQTVKCKINGTDMFIPFSTVEGTYTTAYPIATTSTLTSTCATAGISCSSSTLDPESGRIGKFVGSVANADQGDGYGVFEVQANFSGTVPSGTTANASSFWINVSGSTTLAGTWICVQNNGIWMPTGITTSTTNMCIGARMHYEDTDAAQPAKLVLFSTNLVGTYLTSIFEGTTANFGVTTVKSTGGVAIPFLDAQGTIYYVNAYTS